MRDTLAARFAMPLKEFYIRRIIVWLDEDREFADTISEYVPEGVRLLVMGEHNRFALRRQIEVDYAQENLLLYCPLGFASDADNDLKDVFLYSEEFRADYWSRMFDEVGIAYDVKSNIALRNQARACATFFKSKERVAKLSGFGGAIRSPQDLLYSIFAVCCGLSDNALNTVVRAVLSEEQSEAPNAKLTLMDKYCGEGAFWLAMENAYGFTSAHKLSLLAAHLLASAASLALDESVLMGMPYAVSQGTVCYALFNEWLQQDQEGLLTLCQQVEQAYDLHDRLRHAGRDTVIKTAVFPCADDLLLGEMFHAYAQGLLRIEDAQALITQRRTKPWFTQVQAYYDALEQITQLEMFHQKYRGGFHYTAVNEVWNAYTRELFRVDTAYRRFFSDYASALAGTLMPMDDSLKAAANAVDRLYNNWFMQELGTCWSDLLYKAQTTGETLDMVAKQQNFYMNHISGDKRTFVIISDAMRYEVAQEVTTELNGRLTGKAECKTMQGVFPTVTWMGMAALLPHTKLNLTDEPRLLCDGMPTDSAHRQAVLQVKCAESVAIDAKTFQDMSRKERGELIHGMKVVYLYHDVIDNAGEHNESGVFTACETAIRELVQLTTILVNDLSASTVLLTADHGFLYNHAPLTETDKADKDFVQGEILQMKRRYALVRNADPAYETLAVSMKEYGQPELSAIAPRAAIRFKMQGGGSQYVHGGLSLQEICLPVIQYTHKRTGQQGFKKSEKVDVTLLGDSRKITNSSFSLTFFQKQPASDKALPRIIEAYFEGDTGKAISDKLRIVADRTNAQDNERSYRVTFHLIGTSFDRTKQYPLVLVDSDEQVVLEKIPFTIDIAFGMNFSF